MGLSISPDGRAIVSSNPAGSRRRPGLSRQGRATHCSLDRALTVRFGHSRVALMIINTPFMTTILRCAFPSGEHDSYKRKARVSGSSSGLLGTSWPEGSKSATSLRACVCALFVGFYSLRTYTYIGTPRVASCHLPTISSRPRSYMGIVCCVFLCPEYFYSIAESAATNLC